MLAVSTGEAGACLSRRPSRAASLLSRDLPLGLGGKAGSTCSSLRRKLPFPTKEAVEPQTQTHSGASLGPEGRRRAWEQSTTQSKGPGAEEEDKGWRPGEEGKGGVVIPSSLSSGDARASSSLIWSCKRSIFPLR